MSITEIIKPIELLKGAHDDTATTGSGCFMNVVAYLNGEDQITDQSPCVHPVLRAFMIRINDRFVPHGYGPRLIPFIQRAMGTQDMDGEWLRWQLVDMAVREILPIYFSHAGLNENAQTLRELPQVTKETRQTAIQACRAVRRDAAAAAANAADAAADAAYDAAADAADDAANAADAAYAYAAAAAADAANAADAAAVAYAYAAAAAADADDDDADAIMGARFDIVEATLDRILPPADTPSQSVIDAAQRLVKIREAA